jgi:hypothetical protein
VDYDEQAMNAAELCDLAVALGRRGLLDDALAAIERALILDSDNTWVWRIKGDILLQWKTARRRAPSL